MPDDDTWGVATWAGNRRRQMEEFQGLSLREKVTRLEQLDEIAEHFALRRRLRDRMTVDTGPDSRGAGQTAHIWYVRGDPAMDHRNYFTVGELTAALSRVMPPEEAAAQARQTFERLPVGLAEVMNFSPDWLQLLAWVSPEVARKVERVLAGAAPE